MPDPNAPCDPHVPYVVGLVSGWRTDATDPGGVLVFLDVDDRRVRLTLSAEDAEALAEDLRTAADEWHTTEDDGQLPPGRI